MMDGTKASTAEEVREYVAGRAWSFFGALLSQGAAIQQDYAAGKYANYEEYAQRVSIAARERLDDPKWHEIVNIILADGRG
jgi:hypothetical protein